MFEAIKQNKEKTKPDLKKISANIKLKFILFFIISFLLLIFFWYYLSCFCAVYLNTQTHLIKDALSSFIISHVYTFITCLLPAALRICTLRAVKKNKSYLYNISQMLENI